MKMSTSRYRNKEYVLIEKKSLFCVYPKWKYKELDF